MVRIFVDGAAYEVGPGRNLLQACLELGFDLPYFCWHPAMGSVGACRQCAVKQYRDQDDASGRIVMACMTPAADGTRISIDDPQVREFRRQVIEWLMVNHPHDCPVCDEGGHCHLQDMTVMAGHAYRRHRFPKRTHRNQYLGPFLNHEMNRCIQCYRCVRFYRDYAGGSDLNVFGAHDAVYFGRAEDGVLESEFAGNLAEVCPTGVFTDRTLGRHYTRKWDLQMAPSVCTHCAVGCNTFPGERYGSVRCVLNRFNDEVNGYFLCDRGRFAYEYLEHGSRLTTPRVGRGAAQAEALAPTALAEARQRLAGCDLVLGIGSPRAALEANFALREMVGEAAFSTGMTAHEQRLVDEVVDILRGGTVPAATLREAEDADAVLVLGEDVAETAPRAALALRQAVHRGKLARSRELGIPDWNDAAVRDAGFGLRAPLFVATPAPTRLDDIAARTVRAGPDDIARLGAAVAHALDPEAPAVEGTTPALEEAARALADALGAGARPLVVAGTGLGSLAVLRAAADVAAALARRGAAARLLLVVPECNSLGVALLGGRPLEELAGAADGAGRVGLVVLGNDLSRRLAAADHQRLLDGAAAVVAIDELEHATTRGADVVLPAASYAAAAGTLVNFEGRAQRFFQVHPAPGEVRAGWRWVAALAERDGEAAERAWRTLDDVLAALAAARPELAGAAAAAPGADLRLAGQRIPRQPPRYSGRTAMFADVTLHEPQPPPDHDAPLAFSMEGYGGRPPAPVTPWFWAPGWNSPQAVTAYQQEIGGPLVGGPSGVRLLAPAGEPASFRGAAPAQPAAAEEGSLLAVPAWHVFGSDERARLAPAIAERVPAAYVGLAPDDAAARGLDDGAEAELEVGGTVLRLPVRVVEGLAPGVAQVPVGLAGVPSLVLPAAVAVRRGGGR